jgi:glycosyltransferase involved in cell wall biosynthesis
MLEAKGHEVAVIAPSESIYFSEKKIDTITVYGLPSLPIFYYQNIRVPISVLMKTRIKEIIRNFKPDIIHIQDHFAISSMVVNVNKIFNIPIIATNHFMPENITILVPGDNWKQKVENFLWKGFSKVYNQVNLVTTPTEFGGRLIRPRLAVKVKAISSGIDLEKFTPFGNTGAIKKKYGLPEKPALLYVGRLDPEKHIEEILHSVAEAIKRTDFCFVIVGKGTSKLALEQLTQKLGITDNVIFTGFVPDEDLPYFYKLSRCFIIASIAELLSLVTLQAMASGLPVISVKAGALVELVNDGVNGYLFAEGDIPAIAEQIVDIINNDNHYREMREKSLEFIQQHDIYKTLESFEHLYQTAVGKLKAEVVY